MSWMQMLFILTWNPNTGKEIPTTGRILEINQRSTNWWDTLKLMSGAYRWWIMVIILVFREHLFTKADVNPSRRNWPLSLLFRANSYWRNLSSKIHALRYHLTVLPRQAGRQAIWSPPYSSHITSTRWGGGHRKKGKGYSQVYTPSQIQTVNHTYPFKTSVRVSK